MFVLENVVLALRTTILNSCSELQPAYTPEAKARLHCDARIMILTLTNQTINVCKP